MAGERTFLQVPPDSTGKRVRMTHTAEIFYSGLQNAHKWSIGALYYTTFSDSAVYSIHVHAVHEISSTTGVLEVHYNKTPKYENLDPVVGNIIYSDAGASTTIATITSFREIYINSNHIIGYDNPDYGLDVDITGSANIRFSEGLPQLDAWGKLRTSGATHIGDYVFGQKEILDNNFSPIQLNGGTVTYNDDRNSVTVKVPGPADPEYTINEGFASCTSNLYHHYVAGSSHLFVCTARLNNPTATGVVRNWGLFDFNNGFMFRIDQTGALVLVIRSNTSGTRVDNVISRSDWNGDKVDGNGDSQENLDLSKDNIYWIDIQWHGAGRVRFGTYFEGARVTLHSYYHGNIYDVAMSGTTSLPTCFSVNAITGPSEDLFIETWSASVWTETTLDLHTKGAPAVYASSHVTVLADAGDPWQYLYSVAPRVELANGETNHTLYMPTSISAYAFENAAGGADAIIDLKMEINSIHEGHSFSNIPGTTTQVSTAGTSYENGRVFFNEMFRGAFQADVTTVYNNWQYGAVKNFADDGGTVVNNIQSITQANPAVMTVATDEVLLVRETATQGLVETQLNANDFNGRYKLIDLSGMTEANDQYVYVKPISSTQCELYTNEELTTGFNTTAFTAHSANTGYIKGFRGSRRSWSVFAKTRTTVHTNPVKLMVTINWKEIIQ